MPTVAYWILLLAYADCTIPESIAEFEFDDMWHVDTLKAVPSRVNYLELERQDRISSFALVGRDGRTLGLVDVLENIELHVLVHDVRVQDLFIVCPGLTEADQGVANEFGYDVVQADDDVVVLHLRDTNERMARE